MRVSAQASKESIGALKSVNLTFKLVVLNVRIVIFPIHNFDDDGVRYKELENQLRVALHHAGSFGKGMGNPNETINLENRERSS